MVNYDESNWNSVEMPNLQKNWDTSCNFFAY